MAQAAREELPPVPHSLLPPGSMTAAIAQIQMETESVIITRTDPASTRIQTGTGSVIAAAPYTLHSAITAGTATMAGDTAAGK